MTDEARTPPHDAIAERSILGAVLIDPGCLARAAALLEPGDFYRPAHQLLWEAMQALDARHVPIDVVTMADELRASGTLAGAGGVQYLGTVTDSIPTGALVEVHAKIVARHARTRRMITGAQQLVLHCHAGDEDRTALAARVQGLLAETDSGREDQAVRLDRVVGAAMDRYTGLAEKPRGWAMGIPGLDRRHKAGGISPGHVWVLAAHPGRGKTSLALQMALHVAQSGNVLFFSLEMPRDDLADRALSAESRIPAEQLAGGDLVPGDVSMLDATCARLAPLPLWIDDTSDPTIGEIRVRARLHAQRHGGLALVVVDYVQLARPDHPSENREREVSEVMSGLRTLARELGCGVLALAQLNRQTARSRSREEPDLCDLRESGRIEQDAATVAFIWHDKDSGWEDEDLEDVPTWLLVKKNRFGRMGRVPLMFHRETTSFDERIPEPDDPPPETDEEPRRTNGHSRRYGQGVPAPQEPDEGVPFDV